MFGDTCGRRRCTYSVASSTDQPFWWTRKAMTTVAEYHCHKDEVLVYDAVPLPGGRVATVSFYDNDLCVWGAEHAEAVAAPTTAAPAEAEAGAEPDASAAA